MYKLYAFVFFSLHVGTLGVLLLNSNLIFHTDFGKIVFFIYLLVYASFILVFISKSFVELKKDTVLTRVLKKLITKYPFLTKVGKGGGLVKNLMYLFIFFFVAGIGFWGASRYVMSIAPTIIKNTFYPKNSVTNGQTVANYSPEFNKLSQELKDLKERHFEEKRKEFFDKNEAIYSSSDDLYTVYLAVYDTSMSQSGFDNKVNYRVRICDLNDQCRIARFGDVTKESTYTIGSITINQSEVIQDLSFKRYETEFTKKPFFILKLTTDKETHLGVVYPSSLYENTDYSISERTLDSTSEISYTFADVEQSDDDITFSLERNIIAENLSAPEIVINETSYFDLKFSPAGNKVNVLYTTTSTN